MYNKCEVKYILTPPNLYTYLEANHETTTTMTMRAH